MITHSSSRGWRLGFIGVWCVWSFLCAFNLHAQSAGGGWPERPLRLVVAAPAGSSLDAIARPLADNLKERLGQAVVVENVPATGGTQAADRVAKAPPDGYTLLLGFNAPLAFAPFLYRSLPYNPAKDLAPVIMTTLQPNVLVVPASMPVNTIKDLIPYLSSRPGQLNYASVGNGSSSHLAMEMFKKLTRTELVHVPYNGSPPAVLSLLDGSAQFLFAVPTALAVHIQSGKLKALAVTGRERYPLLPEVPTVMESGIPALSDFEVAAWNGILVPAGTPRDIIMRLNAEINNALSDPAMKQALTAAGLKPVGGSPDAFSRFLKEEASKWGVLIKQLGIELG